MKAPRIAWQTFMPFKKVLLLYPHKMKNEIINIVMLSAKNNILYYTIAAEWKSSISPSMEIGGRDKIKCDGNQLHGIRKERGR